MLVSLLTDIIYTAGLHYPDIVQALQAGSTIVYIKGFPLTEDTLISFIAQLGEPVNEKRNNNRGSVFDVTIAHQNNIFQSFANSNLAFPLHTDGADFEVIPNCLAFLCVEPAEENQGANNFTFLQDVLPELTEIERQALLQKKWQFNTQSRSILMQNNGAYSICYDRITMESFSELSENELAELDKLDDLFESHSFKVKLQKGDMVLFRNDLVLHGRDEIDINSRRLLKRIRFNLT